jgi:uncharacterized protein DUF4126
VDTLLDYLQAFGLGLAVGVRPFLAVLVAGGLAIANAGVNFGGTEFSFLESLFWMIAVFVALVASLLGRARLESPAAAAAFSGLSIGLGALLGAGSLDDRLDTWWPGLLVGAAGAVLSNAATRDLLARAAKRLDDPQARAALPAYAETVAAVVALASIVFPVLALVAAGLFVWLLVGGRRREGEKYAGLRILR